MAEIIEFRPKASGRIIIDETKDEVRDEASQDVAMLMEELSELLHESKPVSEDGGGYTSMAAKVTDILEAISHQYKVDPRWLLMDILYLQASKEIVNNIVKA